MKFFNNKQIEKLNQLIDQGFINYNKHPDRELYIYNYTNNCQFEKQWNEITLYARGLILDCDYNLVARPFKKFFNLSELESEYTPNIQMTNNYVLQDKMDGFFGIAYPETETRLKVASRGSFSSPMAEKANQILYEKYSQLTRELMLMHSNLTFIFEIIYPKREQEINLVVDYGETRDLYLIGVIENETGRDLMITGEEPDLPFPKVREFDIHHDRLMDLTNLNWNNHEGLVVKFDNSEFIKIKFEEYVRQFNILKLGSYKQILEAYFYGNINDVKSRLDDLDIYNREFIDKIIEDVDRDYKQIYNYITTKAEELTDYIVKNYLYSTDINDNENRKIFANKIFELTENIEHSKMIRGLTFKLLPDFYINKKTNIGINNHIFRSLREKYKNQ